MLRIDKTGKKLVRLSTSVLASAEHWERDLQSMICADPDSFFEEIGERLLVIGEEIRPSNSVPDRIDILALDESGIAVVIELKRGTHKLHLLQAISYAGMVSRWSAEQFLNALETTRGQSPDDAAATLENHVGPAAWASITPSAFC